jgi:hypothetical protein
MKHGCKTDRCCLGAEKRSSLNFFLHASRDVTASKTTPPFLFGGLFSLIGFGLPVRITNFPPAAVNARMSWSIETSDAARSILATRG